MFVVDAKNYAGKIDFGKLIAPYFGGKAILKINGRNRNNLLEGVEKQSELWSNFLQKLESTFQYKVFLPSSKQSGSWAFSCAPNL